MTFIDPAEMEGNKIRDVAGDPPQYPADHSREQQYFYLSDAIGAVDKFAGQDDMTVGDLADLLRVIRDAKRNLSDVEHTVENRLGAMMEHKEQVIAGVGIIERSKRADRKNWDSPLLLSAVMDSRLVDKSTGEVLEETPVEKIVAVYGTTPRGAPEEERSMAGRTASLTELRRRKIDPDRYCDVEVQDGYSIRLTTT